MALYRALITPPRSACERWLAALWQLSLVLGLDQLYEVGRGLIPSRPAKALNNAARIIHLEDRLRIFREPSIQHYWLRPHSVGWLQIPTHQIVNGLNLYYLYGHFLGTALFLIWLYFFRAPVFRFVRDVLFVSTAVALVIYIVFPMAPPRLVPAGVLAAQGAGTYHFQDTLSTWLNNHLQSLAGDYNPYAAMPSLHFIWACIVGATLTIAGRHLVLRLLGPLYTGLMLATIVISANHFILDAVASVVIALAAAACVWVVEGLASGRMRLPQAWGMDLPPAL